MRSSGTCALHVASNGFLEGVKALMDKADIDLDQIKLSGFFKYSEKRVQDFFDAESFTERHGRRILK